MNNLAGQTVAIVAQGPSGTDQGAEIDACDFVVRQNAWLTEGPKNAGTKISALCGFGGIGHPAIGANSKGLEVPPQLAQRRDWELWCHIPADCFQSVPTPNDVGDWKWLLGTADGRVIRTIRSEAFHKLEACMWSLNPQRPYLSLGIVCLAMVIDLEPKAIHIWGYDSTKFGLPSYDLAQKKLANHSQHDFVSEKIIIAGLADLRTWCGQSVNIPFTWHGRPQDPLIRIGP